MNDYTTSAPTSRTPMAAEKADTQSRTAPLAGMFGGAGAAPRVGRLFVVRAAVGVPMAPPKEVVFWVSGSSNSGVSVSIGGLEDVARVDVED